MVTSSPVPQSEDRNAAAVAAVPSYLTDNPLEHHPDRPPPPLCTTIRPRLFSKQRVATPRVPGQVSSNPVVATSLALVPMVPVQASVRVTADLAVAETASLVTGGEGGYDFSSHSKCTRCTRLKSKRKVVSSRSFPSCRVSTNRLCVLRFLLLLTQLLALFLRSREDMFCWRTLDMLGRPSSVLVAAAKVFTRDVRLGARVQPQTQEDILREILRVQQEQLTLLRALLVSSIPASSS